MSVVHQLRDAQAALNKERSIQIKLLDEDVSLVLEIVKLRYFKRGIIAGGIIGFACGAGAMLLVLLLPLWL